MGRQRPVARIEGVSQRYGGAVALEDVTIEIPEGRMVGFIGPDGVGKSTLLSLVSGSRQIQSGSVLVLGGDMADAAHRAAVCPRIAYMPQGLGKNLYADLSVRENIEFFGRLFGSSRLERDEKIAELLDSTGLAPFSDRLAKKLSGGMRQKLGLCCCLIHDPDLLILDEPTTGVDPLSRRQFWELIERMRARSAGMSVMVATAYMEEAERFDWLAAMNAGKVLSTGAPADLRANAHAATLEEAFIALLPPELRGDHQTLEIPPRRFFDGEPISVARDLTCRFADFTAVDRVNFAIDRGEIFGFLGSNGCGKTTTMKMLTGLLAPTAGEALLFGKPLDAGDMSLRYRVGYMSQSFSLYTELTVRQNLDLHAHLYHLPSDKVKTRVAILVEEFGLKDYIDQPTSDLPLGICQRLSLAVAIVHEPEMLILDEPTSGVDPLARDRFWEALIYLSRVQGVTIFVSTHFMNEAERCDRIALMDSGRVLASGPPGSLVKARGVATLEDAFSLAVIAQARSNSQELHNASIAIVDEDNSELSRRIAHAFLPPLFQPPKMILERDIVPEMNKGSFTFVIDIPPNFQRDVLAGRRPGVQIDVDATAMVQAGLGSGYTQEIVANEVRDFLSNSEGAPLSPVNLDVRIAFNPNITTAWFTSVMGIINNITMLAIILAGAAIVREREHGTMDHLLVMPLTPFEIALSKVWANGLVIAVACALSLHLIVRGLLAVPIAGSIPLFMLGVVIYLFFATAIGIFLGTIARSMPQLGLLYMLVFLPMNMLSGSNTPLESMPPWLATAMQASPSTHFVSFAQSILYRGAGFDVVWPEFVAVAAIGGLFFSLAIARFRSITSQAM